jgi:hypothetical protein
MFFLYLGMWFYLNIPNSKVFVEWGPQRGAPLLARGRCSELYLDNYLATSYLESSRENESLLQLHRASPIQN